MPICLILLFSLTSSAVSLSAPLAAPPSSPLVDGVGHAVDVAAEPNRILSGSLASDEITLELLRRTGALGRLQAVSVFAEDPHYSNIVVPPNVKARFGADLERALALKPDLAILASFNQPEILKRFSDAGVKTFVLAGFATLDDIERHVLEIGSLLHTSDAARMWRDEFHSGRVAVRRTAAAMQRRPKILLFHESGVLAAKGSLFDDLVTEAGGENLATTSGLTGWPTVAAEFLAGLSPDIIVAAGDESERASIAAKVAAAPGWRSITNRGHATLVLVPERTLAATSPFVLSALTALNKEFLRTITPGATAPAPARKKTP